MDGSLFPVVVTLALPVASKFNDIVVIAALVMVAKASFLRREFDLKMSRADALKAALEAMKVSGLLTGLKKIVAEVFHQSLVRRIPGLSKPLTREDAEKLIGIVKSYDVVVTESAINFERRT